MRRVVYLMSGSAHLPYLIVSLSQLRKHWEGPVCIFAWPESYAILERISQDQRLGIAHYARTPKYRGKNDQFFDKIRLMQEFVDGPNLYLDADTMPNGNLDFLFDKADETGFCATQFGNWMSNNGQAKNRVNRLIEYLHIPEDLIYESTCDPHPSVNGGVFACLPYAPFLKKWEQWTNPCKESLFIADETVLHVVCRFYEKLNHVHITDGSYNCSPKSKWWPCKQEEVKLWHFHGDSNVRPDKSQFGFDLWWPEYQAALNDNLGFIQDWKHLINNKYLKRCEEMQ